MESIRIIDIRLIDNGKPLKAFADIEVNGIEIRNFRIVQEPKRKAYVVSPQTSWRGQGGIIQYKTLITLPDELKWRIDSAVLAAFQKVKGNENETDQER